MKYLITGASGFIGTHIVKAVGGHNVVGLGRTYVANLSSFIEREIRPGQDFTDCLQGVDCVIHCAAMVHQRNKSFEDYYRVNSLGTIELAEQAASMRVPRFIFLSSVKVNGDESFGEERFSAHDAPQPTDDYGKSKAIAEEALLKIGRTTGLDVVIVRPPLVYGPGVKANFAWLMRAVELGCPMPFGRLNSNRRSMVFVDNLVDLIVKCSVHKRAAGEVFMVSDDRSLSTRRLTELLMKAYRRPVICWPFPEALLVLGLTLLGRRDVAHRLTRSLEVDISKTEELLGWYPPYTVKQAIEKTVGYRS